ncbi:MAG: diadenosine tetraphosphatase [Planctomycetota bacterium]|nr:MAG: diadenosine tetraphosphatase [Planctomycetota bacterium]
MATWAVGDVQGCLASLEHLLEQVAFDPARDQLWLVGDLVNRGPDSLGVLRLVKDLGPAARVVLGNHDLHLLSSAAGLRELRGGDTFDELLAAPDRDELLDWLRRQPLVYAAELAGRQWLMLHAGLHPSWNAARALQLGAEVCEALTRGDGHEALAALVGRPPARWHNKLRGGERLAAIVACLTRLRACEPDGSLCTRFVGPPENVPAGCTPWWAVPDRAAADGPNVVCGHWAAQGYRVEPGMLALDTGCVWGGSLTAARLEDGETRSVPNRDEGSPRR